MTRCGTLWIKGGVVWLWGDYTLRTPAVPNSAAPTTEAGDAPQASRPLIFTGRHKPKVDDKRRMQVPSEWRGGRMGGIRFLFVPEARDGVDAAFIKVLPEHRLERLYDKLNELGEFDEDADAVRRTVGADSVLVETDNAGRVCLPEEMVKAAGLNGEVLLVGAFGHFEIWPVARGDAALQADRPRALARRRELKV